MNRTAEEQRAEGERINGIVKNYWDEVARRGGPSLSSSWKKPPRSAPLATSFPKPPKIDETVIVAGLRQDLAAAQHAASQVAAEATSLQTRITELETECAAHAKARRMMQESLRAARWHWTVGGLGGCIVTISVIGGFIIHFLLP